VTPEFVVISRDRYAPQAAKKDEAPNGLLFRCGASNPL
jgi:hypothetical protein